MFEPAQDADPNSCWAASKVPSGNGKLRRGCLPTKPLPCKRGACSSLCASAHPDAAPKGGGAGRARSAPLIPQGEERARGYTDAEADMPSAEASGAICVQRFDGSRNSAIHTTYRISRRSSSIREPRYPLLRVVFGLSGQAAEPAATVASEEVEVWGVLSWIRITDASPTGSGEAPAGPNCGPEGPQPGDRRPRAGRPEGRLAAEGDGWLPEWIRLIQ